MNKLLGYFVKKKDASTSDVDFPQLEKEEEEEIQQHLGIPTGTLNTRALLMATLKNFSQYDEEENGTITICFKMSNHKRWVHGRRHGPDQRQEGRRSDWYCETKER